MARNRIKINERALQRAIAPQVAAIQADANERLRNVIRSVRDEMTGQPVDQVHAELVRRLRSELPGVTPNEANLRSYSEEIAAGTLKD